METSTQTVYTGLCFLLLRSLSMQITSIMHRQCWTHRYFVPSLIFLGSWWFFFSAFEGLRQASECGPPPPRGYVHARAPRLCPRLWYDPNPVHGLTFSFQITQRTPPFTRSHLTRQFLAVHQHTHIKYRLHISVCLHTSALIILDEWRVWACGTHESPGYPRLPQVSLKQDAVLHEGLGRHLTIADGESGAQERQKEEPSLKYWWDGCLFCCSSEVHFSDVSPRGVKKMALVRLRRTPALVSPAFEGVGGGGKKCCLTEINSNASIKDSSPSAGLRGYVVKPPRRPREMGQDGEQNEFRLCGVSTKQPQRLLWSTRRS